MTDEQVLEEFRQAGALLTGHFILTSGLRSATFLQCARVMMDARRGERLCAALAGKVRAELGDGAIDMIASPAMGGVVVGYEMGRQLGVPALFLERVEGQFTLRRGFSIPEGSRCLIVEDIVTTGLSSRECIAAIEALGATVVAASCLIDRSGGNSNVGVPLVPLVRMTIPVYEADAVPAELAAIPPVKPGSRSLK